MSLIIVHELGHFLFLKIFNWNVDKIYLYPFGGCVKFNEKINKPLYQELLIMLMGPIFQLLFFLLLFHFHEQGLLSYRNYLLYQNYNNTLLIFNLLPIYPLDGGKLLNILMQYLFPYKRSNSFIIILSYMGIILLLFYSKNINLSLMIILLIIEVTIFLKQQDYLFNKFLLERYLNYYNYKKVKVISKKENMYRNKKNIIKYKNKYFTEKDFLKERFK